MNSDLLSRKSDKNIIDVIKEQLSESKEVYIASAFISRAALNQLAKDFDNFKDKGGRVKLLTSVMNNFNSIDNLKAVEDRNIDLRIFFPGASDFNTSEDYKNNQPPSFHIKAFLFQKNNRNNALIIGSSNLTMGGLSNNHEWNYFSDHEVNLTENGITIFDKALNEFNDYWHDTQSIELNQSFCEYYAEQCRRATEKRIAVSQTIEAIDRENAEPRPSQIEALARLEHKRTVGVNKTAVIAATGLGKTYLAAFDFKASGMRNILFIAHRENILTKTQETFKIVCGDDFESVILSGNATDQDRIDAYTNEQSVFAMIQTLSIDETLKKFGQLDFEYIVVDEFHHSEAATYQRVLNHFKPKFFLGLTATPERMDGKDVLEYCNNDIAYEKRLMDAIDHDWLAPFQYFAIYDDTDYSQIRWTGKGYDESELEAKLSKDTRVELIVTNLKRYLPSNGKIKALAFCSNIGHARYMTDQFNAKGVNAKYVIGKTGIEERETIINDLQDESNSLQIVCSVDVFGEGVDIPEVSHILLLRPTQSFTVFLQQLGRGLRKTLNKDFCVILDFIGNFEKSYVAPLGLKGVTDITDRVAVKSKIEIPDNCYLDIDTEVQKIWDEEIRRIVAPRNKRERLIDIYNELRENLDHSPNIMDFFANIAVCDPRKFINEFDGWLKTKKEMDDLTDYENSLLDSNGEAFLLHLEKELKPNKSYKMVVLTYLLFTEINCIEWNIENIATAFKQFYLDNLEYLWDYPAMHNVDEPENYSIGSVKTHVCNMPLNYLSNADDDCFILDRDNGTFMLKDKYHDYWKVREYRELVKDRVEFALKRYFYEKQAKVDYYKINAIQNRLNNNLFSIEDKMKTKLTYSQEEISEGSNNLRENRMEYNSSKVAKIAKIVSGGQTGADRGGLDAAIELGIPHGGWCPKGRLAEDGVIPSKYSQKEMTNKNYLKRTEKNVQDSDATIIFTPGKPKGGSKRTAQFAQGKPCLIIDTEKNETENVEKIVSWLKRHEVSFTLNIAGSRESKAPGLQEWVKDVMIEVICEINAIRKDSHQFVDKADFIELPFYSDLKVACGIFKDGSLDYEAETMNIPNPHNNLDPKLHFIVRASGDSMDGGNNPIKDGDMILLELNTGGTISNQIFAVEYIDKTGNTSYVLKRIEKLSDGNYKLVSVNKRYEAIQVNPETMFPFARFKYICDSNYKNNMF